MPIDPKFLKAEEPGIRLEVVSGLPIWEAHPVWKHQKAIDRIRTTITPGLSSSCSCIAFDPTSLLVLHARRDKTVRLTSPQKLSLECGCELSV